MQKIKGKESKRNTIEVINIQAKGARAQERNREL